MTGRRCALPGPVGACIAIALSVLALLPAMSAAAPVSAVDDLGRTVRLPAPAARVISLSPHVTELLFEIGAGSQVVAVERNSDHPPAARALPALSALPRPDPERLLAFAPDLVVLWGAGITPDRLRRLEAFGLAVFVSEPRTLDAIADTAQRLGALTGHTQRADALATATRTRIAALRARHAGRGEVPVFVQAWSKPLMTLSDRDLVGDALAACGAKNVFGALPQAAAEVDPEAVLRRAPRLVIAFDAQAGRRLWDGLRVLAPVGPIAYLPADRALQRPTPRALDALEALCAGIDQIR